MAEIQKREICELVHDLAEALQSAMNYAAALRRAMRFSATPGAHTDVIEHAVDELGRATCAFHDLRRRLAANPDPYEVSPITWSRREGGRR